MSGSLEKPAAGAVAFSDEAEFRLDLVRKYNRPGPRYTSYPTAPRFFREIDRERLLEDPADSGGPKRPLSLYAHLPFCESACWFCGCTKVITRDRSSADRYLDYLEREIGLIAERADLSRELVQLHFGGGTPTFLTPEQLRRLGRILHRGFRFAESCESGVEIDPRRLSREHIAALREIGCNRASLGVQDHNPVVQQAVHRVQPRELTEQAVDWLRETGFHSINIDLIYGLPHQTVESFTRTVAEVLELRPDRLAVFSYAHVPWIKPAQKIFDRRQNLPDDETKLAILEQVSGQLLAAGYVYIGMDHFALRDDELAVARRAGTLQRNFQGYSTLAGVDICALGMSAISQTAHAYRQNEKDLDDYYRALDEGRLPIASGYLLTADDRIRRATIMRLMCDLRLDFAELSRRMDIDFPAYFEPEIQSLAPMAADGLVTVSRHAIEVTPVGRFLLRNIAMSFDAYLGESPVKYSKTI